ncbi:MAG: 5-amino-6-(5-phosphoribosylamino)uracil reductase [Candidatus Methanoliparum thermophilum]|uniref:5-amino-6-(5-phosphoribosylamino)uracil reductase n=1 Tax=Methanoliparum thermophilum TaxID=2491083 RepID=A0A520KSX6_METT2|nr:dihydrofolate reductase family protein [Candidatus Methanoliparum sp. LAM-1]RZN64518.1 MAG: 5-amino-6-(5-phosphoribosylamino)uracil reductase [Candidatus Methanoliparum thermophilum]BDC35886.1 2,5-diamino-6-ribosylamino-4(3H)-pyrimidinone 5'-phosphate reductase [Candidatus Methanoliparum sp. LAM-1]
MKKPYLFVISEMTLDGKLTLRRGVSSKIIMNYMSKESNIFLHKERASSDAIMVGCNTIKIDNSNLTVRYVKGRSPIRIIPCSFADIPLNSNVLDKSAPTIIVTSKKAPAKNIDAIRRKGVEVMVCGEDKVDFKLLMENLYAIGIKKLMVEGGPTILWNILKDQLVDEIKIIHLPILIGGRDAPSLVEGEGIKDLSDIFFAKLKGVRVLGKDLLTEYKIIYKKSTRQSLV